MWVWVDVGVGVWHFQEHDTTRTLRHPHLFHPYCQEHAWVVWVWVHPQVGVGATHTHLLPCTQPSFPSFFGPIFARWPRCLDPRYALAPRIADARVRFPH